VYLAAFIVSVLAAALTFVYLIQPEKTYDNNVLAGSSFDPVVGTIGAFFLIAFLFKAALCAILTVRFMRSRHEPTPGMCSTTTTTTTTTSAHASASPPNTEKPSAADLQGHMHTRSHAKSLSPTRNVASAAALFLMLGLTLSCFPCSPTLVGA
jgi:hypothetical protein